MDLLDVLRRRRLLAIVRGRDPEAAVRTAHVLVEEGIDVLEVSLSGAGALDVIARLHAELGASVTLGAGTVLTEAEADAALEAGARFVVTPAMSAGAARALSLGVPALVGALTPTEVWHAWQAGATAVKVFPASLGGPGYLSALRDPFPSIPLIPVGGVTAEQIRPYLEAGAVAVGVGSPLTGDAPHGSTSGHAVRRDNAAYGRATENSTSHGDVTKDGTPREGTSGEGTPRDGTSGDGTRRDGTSGDGTPRDGTPEGGALSEGAPGDGVPGDRASHDGVPWDGVLAALRTRGRHFRHEADTP
ncbi:bifunctional 4-hydroxy-2-oxoglutarate aldolase/2-dehydro-3-deoxy-phosphogluconate aldolase [Nonomuraea rhodomycinica]|uniref:bifunctional 4-hydroxy-2-oxoglutarate aldolase/2-dehydro-3-deoxy-phosphogluconate aldolase n=1 Tax=Nonomuraea rhodomycinica TaxID=1712872 RepID=UPI001C379E61|nr:bifunctional 4-hydroxy-2-oxoglutarate aldolase/2-dehydro-3-deoxy-phosphogluconate aldolase [Nonomuraea rhodomycinica]